MREQQNKLNVKNNTARKALTLFIGNELFVNVKVFINSHKNSLMTGMWPGFLHELLVRDGEADITGFFQKYCRRKQT
jgi:hypothetical protein